MPNPGDAAYIVGPAEYNGRLPDDWYDKVQLMLNRMADRHVDWDYTKTNPVVGTTPEEAKALIREFDRDAEGTEGYQVLNVQEQQSAWNAAYLYAKSLDAQAMSTEDKGISDKLLETSNSIHRTIAPAGKILDAERKWGF